MSNDILRKGQIVFQTVPLYNYRTLLGVVIKGATGNRITHTGIIDREDNGDWVVIEADSTKVQVTPWKKFKRWTRSTQVELKWIKGMTNEQAEDFVAAARKYIGQPYDAKFLYDNGQQYCSELVAVAARDIGIDLFSAEIPARWLEYWKPSVRAYLWALHGVSSPRDIDPKWKMIPPHTLYYSNDLETVKGSTVIKDATKESLRHYLYDTLPGTNTDDKFWTLMYRWAGNISDITLDTEPTAEGYINYYFGFFKDEEEHSITLFGKFPEELKLARMIFEMALRIQTM